MKRILVTTDLSKSSKTGLKFAIQLASQYEVSLVFFYTIELLIPTRWNDVKAKIHMDNEIEAETENLRKFVMQTYKESKRRPGKFECVVRYGAPVSNAVLEYAKEIHANYICMSTRGAGELKKLIGTHTSAVIKKSPVPVFAIPKNYKASAIKEILYASDLSELKNELHTVKGLARKLGSSVSVVHYDIFPKLKSKTLDDVLVKRQLSGVKFHLERFSLDENIGWHLNKAARKFKSDVVAMFTDNKRAWYERILGGSDAVTASYENVKPLLVFPR
jgi:nucleotide-binding universal stress UspA family protein